MNRDQSDTVQIMLSEGRLVLLNEITRLAVARVGFSMRGTLDTDTPVSVAFHVVWQIQEHIALTAADDTALESALNILAGVLSSLASTSVSEENLAQRLVEMGSRDLSVHLAAVGVAMDAAVQAATVLDR